MATSSTNGRRDKKRAIALAGGGPAAGLHIGVLQALEKHGVTFDVWSLSCIGAWVGVYYNQLEKEERAEKTKDFFKDNVFRDTESYSGFPVNKAFAPNLGAHATAWLKHLTDPVTYFDAFNVRNDLPAAIEGWQKFLQTPKMWFQEGDVNTHVLNDILAVHPASRFLTSLLYLSEINGLSNIYYKESTFLDRIDIDKLNMLHVKGLGQMSRAQLDAHAKKHANGHPAKVPEIYHNAWRITDGNQRKGDLQLFNNNWAKHRNERNRDYLPVSRASLCACSALPYVEQTVQVPNDDNKAYSEGALVDTVSFRQLVEDHPDLDEIWVCRIVGNQQLQLPKNLHDSLGNLCEQFAAEVGENDIDLFKNHLRKSAGRIPRVVEIPLHVNTKVNYRWDHKNLGVGVQEGNDAVELLIGADGGLADPTTSAPPWP